MSSHKEFKKSNRVTCWNYYYTIKITLYVKFGNSKLELKVMKPVLASSFYLKIKNKSSHLIGMVRMVEPLSIMLPPSSNARRYIKKSWDHRFRDHLEIVILSFELCWLLKDIQGMPTVPSYTHMHTDLYGKEHIQSISREPLLVKKIWPGGCCGLQL